jgi:hypothetical protein
MVLIEKLVESGYVSLVMDSKLGGLPRPLNSDEMRGKTHAAVGPLMTLARTGIELGCTPASIAALNSSAG